MLENVIPWRILKNYNTKKLSSVSELPFEDFWGAAVYFNKNYKANPLEFFMKLLISKGSFTGYPSYASATDYIDEIYLEFNKELKEELNKNKNKNKNKNEDEIDLVPIDYTEEEQKRRFLFLAAFNVCNHTELSIEFPWNTKYFTYVDKHRLLEFIIENIEDYLKLELKELISLGKVDKDIKIEEAKIIVTFLDNLKILNNREYPTQVASDIVRLRELRLSKLGIKKPMPSVKISNVRNKFYEMIKNNNKNKEMDARCVKYWKWKEYFDSCPNLLFEAKSKTKNLFSKETFTLLQKDDLIYGLFVAFAISTKFGCEFVEKAIQERRYLEISIFLSTSDTWVFYSKIWQSYIANCDDSNLSDVIECADGLWDFIKPDRLTTAPEISKAIFNHLAISKKNSILDCLFRKIIFSDLVEQKYNFIKTSLNSLMRSYKKEFLKACFDLSIGTSLNSKEKEQCMLEFISSDEKNFQEIINEFVIASPTIYTRSTKETYNSPLKIFRLIMALVDLKLDLYNRLNIYEENKVNEIYEENKVNENLKKIEFCENVIRDILEKNVNLCENFKGELWNFIAFYYGKATEFYAEEKNQTIQNEFLNKFNLYVSYLKTSQEIKESKSNNNIIINKKEKYRLYRVFELCFINLERRSCTDIEEEDLLTFWNFGLLGNNSESKNDARVIKFNALEEMENAARKECENLSWFEENTGNLKKVAIKFIKNIGIQNIIDIEDINKFIIEKINQGNYRSDFRKEKQEIGCRNTAVEVCLIYVDFFVKENKENDVMNDMLQSYLAFGSRFNNQENKIYVSYSGSDSKVHDDEFKNPARIIKIKGHTTTDFPVDLKAWALFCVLASYVSGKKSTSHHTAIKEFLTSSLDKLSNPLQFLMGFIITVGSLHDSPFNKKGKLVKFLAAAESFLTFLMPKEYAEWKKFIITQLNETNKKLNSNFGNVQETSSLLDIAIFAKKIAGIFAVLSKNNASPRNQLNDILSPQTPSFSLNETVIEHNMNEPVIKNNISEIVFENNTKNKNIVRNLGSFFVSQKNTNTRDNENNTNHINNNNNNTTQRKYSK